MLAALRRLAARARALFSVREDGRDFAEELESHVEMLAEDNVQRGMTPEQARRAALICVGGLGSLAQQHRETRALAAVDAITRDVRFALRSITKDHWISATGCESWDGSSPTPLSPTRRTERTPLSETVCSNGRAA